MSKRKLLGFVIQVAFITLIPILPSLDLPKETILRNAVRSLPFAFVGALLVYFIEHKLMKGMEDE